MGKKCKGCPYGYGSPDTNSDFCNSCRNDPDTGWGGYTDHSTGKHYDNGVSNSWDDEDEDY